MSSVPPVSGVATQNPPASSSSSSGTAAAAASATVDYNSFLKLMITELQNQDPTSPADPTAYMSQLASFSSVEQQINTNTKLDAMLTDNALSQADSIIGKTVTSADGTTSGTVASVTLGAGGAATATLSSGAQVPLGSGVTVSGS